MKKSTLFICLCILSLLTKTKQLEAENIICFTPGTCCEEMIIQMIKTAQKEIMIAIEEITSTRIFKELIKAYSEGVRILIITNRKKFLTKSSLVYALNKHGVMVRMSSLIEEKNRFAIFDNVKLITGSYNWTMQEPSLTSNNCITLDDKKVVLNYSKHFKKLWNSYTDEIYDFYVARNYQKDKKFTKFK